MEIDKILEFFFFCFSRKEKYMLNYFQNFNREDRGKLVYHFFLSVIN